MPFAVRRLVTVAVVALLGLAAALLVACGDSNGLIPGDEASSLRNALDGVQSACANGQVDRAEASAAQFQRNVAQLQGADVDRRLIRELRSGAGRLQTAVAQECATVTETIETQTDTVEPPPVTTPETTTPAETTPAETTPAETTPSDGTTTPPDEGGTTTPSDGTTPPDDGTTPPDGGATPPDTGETPVDPGTSNTPEVNRGTPGGALAPGQGGTE